MHETIVKDHREEKSPDLSFFSDIVAKLCLEHVKSAKPVGSRLLSSVTERLYEEVDDQLNHIDYSEGDHDFESGQIRA